MSTAVERKNDTGQPEATAAQREECVIRCSVGTTPATRASSRAISSTSNLLQAAREGYGLKHAGLIDYEYKFSPWQQKCADQFSKELEDMTRIASVEAAKIPKRKVEDPENT